MKRYLIWLCTTLFLGSVLNTQSFAQSNSANASDFIKPSADPKAPIIRSITINVRDMFEGNNLSTLYETANELKIKTKQRIIRQELLFREGDPYIRNLIQESERNLRFLGYLHKVSIDPSFDGGFVDITVNVQDTWTLIPFLAFSSGGGTDDRTAVGITESNLLGYGKRLEFLYDDDNGRESLSGIWEDYRVWGSNNRLLLAYFDRSDGFKTFNTIQKPFRSLETKRAWEISFNAEDTVGRLFSLGTERFIFGQEKLDFVSSYSFSYGDPKSLLNRFTFGYEYNDADFSKATPQDFVDVDVDPSTVLLDPSLVPEDRQFSYPFIAYTRIVPDFISMNYVDRFERVEDFNLGNVFSVKFGAAPEFLGSNEDATIFSVNDADGIQLTNSSFIRGELGFSTRYTSDGFENSLLRGEFKYVYAMGPRYLGGLFIGNHTIVGQAVFNYGDKLDGDREFLLGAETGLRGYDSSTFYGDKLFVANLEDRFHLADDIYKLVSLGGAFFIDVGGVTEDNFGTIFSDEMYADLGFGLRFAFPRSTGARVVRLDVAFPLREGPDGSKRFELRILATGGQLFDALLGSEKAGVSQVNLDAGSVD